MTIPRVLAAHAQLDGSVQVLLQLLGGQQRVELARNAIEAV